MIGDIRGGRRVPGPPKPSKEHQRSAQGHGQGRRRQKSIDELIAENRASMKRAEERIRTEKELSDEGKRRKLEQSWQWHRERHQELVDEQKATRAAKREQLERKVFAPKSGNQQSYREALDIASRVQNPNEMNELYQQAISVGDEEMQQALTYHSVQRGYQSIVEDYGKRNPQAAQALAEYSSPEVSPREMDRVRERLFSPRPQKPEEIRKSANDV